MGNAKKFLKLDKTSRFSTFNQSEQILIEEGFDLVKRYISKKMDTSPEYVKRGFANAFDDVLAKEDKPNRNEEVLSKLVEYCLRSTGRDMSNFTLNDLKDPNLNGDPAFRRKFGVILAQIITPVIPALISAEYMEMADIVNVGWGDTGKFKVKSNDLFYVTRQAEGILTGSVQRVYNDEITINPEPFNVTTAVDWYQVAAGVFDIGDFAYKVGLAYSEYVSLTIVTAMETFVQNSLPTVYKSVGFTTAKFANLVEIVKAANGNGNVRAYGTLPALMSVLPGTAPSTVVANLQQGLGEEWTRTGYLGRYFGVDMVRIPQIMLPNTINTEALLGIPSDVIYLIADGGYKPVKVVFEGTTITTDIRPTEAPDKEMGLSMTFRMGVSFINASKFGAVTDIVAPAI